MGRMTRLLLMTVALAAFAVGAARAAGGDEHHHEAPHGGALVPIGDHVGHLEIVLRPAGKLTVYVLDAEAERAVWLKQETIAMHVSFEGGADHRISLDAVANPLTGETVGDSSEFAATVPPLDGVGEFEGTIAVVEFLGRRYEHIEFHYPEGHHGDQEDGEHAPHE